MGGGDCDFKESGGGARVVGVIVSKPQGASQHLWSVAGREIRPLH